MIWYQLICKQLKCLNKFHLQTKGNVLIGHIKPDFDGWSVENTEKQILLFHIVFVLRNMITYSLFTVCKSPVVAESTILE